MSDLKISQLATESPLAGTELVEVVTGGINKKTTTQDIADLGGGGVTDGDKGDITVSGSGTVWTLDTSAAAIADIEFSLVQTLRNLYNY